MQTFQIPNMTCGHCVRAITEAVQAVDPAAQVQADLPQHQVQVQTSAPRDKLVAQLTEAGYAPA
ncbi:MAG: heavy-metal-associated domain-containing protein [Rubrivivax sp.]|nr:heavy-metal-associated domain-containing protein [Rubrivivax sp.]MDP3223659.1 heavy-metal-associated domain-containing protein [Rubrivivax sp.]